MADYKRRSKSSSDDGGPETEGGRVKTKPVSSSTAGGGEAAGKRSALQIDADEEELASKAVPAKVSKIGFGLSSQMGKKGSAISIKLGASKPKEPTPSLPAKKATMASVFNEDDDSEPEEMPPEAKMRMKNIGRETPTSAGPNSFNKGKQGFSDHQKLWERKMKTQSDHT
ncbi:PEST proteolytic signal-containing nuclear protein [Merluccius polli]|uniref:PEST proteolytic signal-containing nuclear protein n=1 Tax=Merluccius polli TaxID=89951 RepID=A0AA47NQU0_MERPO|nr:PEST proteolytic signal-containing nuclear protein [Merluccius polli]